MSGPERRRRRTVRPEETGARLDRWLAARLPGHSRTQVQVWIREGRVTVDGRPARPSRPLEAGELVRVRIPPPPPAALEPRPLDLDVLYEDDDLAVLNKPPGLVVHPGAGIPRTTLAHALLARWPGWDPPGSPTRPGILHRLDRDTSGLLAVARSARAYQELTQAMAARAVTRRYVALVVGGPELDAGEIDAPIGRDARDRRRMAVRRGGRPARTEWRVVRRFDTLSLLDLTLGTGRTHQIRVHLAHAGFPVFGDPVYGGAAALQRVSRERRPALELLRRRLSRQALHAYHLAFRHPVGGDRLRFEAPVPADMDEVLVALAAEAPAGGGAWSANRSA